MQSIRARDETRHAAPTRQGPEKRARASLVSNFPTDAATRREQHVEIGLAHGEIITRLAREIW